MSTSSRPVIFAFLLFVWTASAWAAGVGEVTRLVGEADVTRGSAPAQILRVGDAVQAKDVLRTKKDSLLEVSMTDGSRLTLGESSRLEVANYAAGDQPDALLDLTRGRLRSFVTDVFSSRSESFRVRTPTAVAGVQGTDFEVSPNASSTVVTVFQGLVVTYNANPQIPERQIVPAGWSVVVEKGKAPEKPKEFSTSNFGSGGQANVYFGGDQGNDPLGLTPTVESSVPVPPIPNPPGR
jgi:hypothetical protein